MDKDDRWMIVEHFSELVTKYAGKQKEDGSREATELGIWPPASPRSKLYEPEAIEAYAYAPAGMRNSEN